MPSSEAPMHISIVIVGFRNVDDIQRCLAALEKSDYADFEVIIAENGGQAAFAALRAGVPERLAGGQTVTLVDAGANLGFAGGVNLGIAQTPAADAWWVLNPDTIPEPSTLSALVGRLERGDCDAVGGVLYFANGAIQSNGGRWQGWWGRATSLGAGTRLDAPVDAAAIEANLDYLLGASMLIGRSFLEAVGPMREDYFLYAEEIEWFLRGATKGMRLGFAPDARVLHHQGTTTGWSDSLRRRGKLPVYLDERNRLLLTRDCFPGRFPLVAIGALAFMLARFARKRAWRQIGYGVRGWAAALAGERGIPPWHKA